MSSHRRITSLLIIFLYSLHLFFPLPLYASDELVRQLRQEMDDRYRKIDVLDGRIGILEEAVVARRIELADLEKEKNEINSQIQAIEEKTNADLHALYRQRLADQDTLSIITNEMKKVNEQPVSMETQHAINEEYKMLLDTRRSYEAKLQKIGSEIKMKEGTVSAHTQAQAGRILEILNQMHSKRNDLEDKEQELDKLYDNKSYDQKEIARLYERLGEVTPEPPPYLTSVSVSKQGAGIYEAHWEEKTEQEEKDEAEIKKLTRLAQEAEASYKSMQGFEEKFLNLIKEAERAQEEAAAAISRAESNKFYADLAADAFLIVATAGVMGIVAKTGTFATHLASEALSYGLGKGVTAGGNFATNLVYEKYTGSEWKEAEEFDLQQKLFIYVRDRWQESYDFHDLMNSSLRIHRNFPLFLTIEKPTITEIRKAAQFSSKLFMEELKSQSKQVARWGGLPDLKTGITTVASFGKDYLISYFFDGEIAEWKQKHLEAVSQIEYYKEYRKVQRGVFECVGKSIGFFYRELFKKKEEVGQKKDAREFSGGRSSATWIKKKDRFEMALNFSGSVKPPAVTVGGKTVRIEGRGLGSVWKGTFTGDGLEALEKDPKGVPISVSAADEFDRPIDANPETVAYRDPPWSSSPWSEYEPGPDLYHRLVFKSSRGSILFVFDVSGSMEGQPIESAKSAVRAAVEATEEESEMALISFSGCSNVETVLGFTSDKNAVLSAIDGLSTGGATPYAKAISVGRRFLNAHSKMEPKRMVLLSDGMETCQGNPYTAGGSASRSPAGPWVLPR